MTFNELKEMAKKRATFYCKKYLLKGAEKSQWKNAYYDFHYQNFIDDFGLEYNFEESEIYDKEYKQTILNLWNNNK